MDDVSKPVNHTILFSPYIGKLLSYLVFITWALLTIIPLFWMFYSSFKSNEELTRDIYALPMPCLIIWMMSM